VNAIRKIDGDEGAHAFWGQKLEIEG